jgi:hypothetical protein
MILVFIDETSDTKFKDYLGLSCAVVKHNYYRQIKVGFQQILIKGGWNPTIEFKGSYLFSASKGCIDIPVEKRVEMAEEIIDLNIANKNARMKFAYLKSNSTDGKREYLRYLPPLLYKVLPKPIKGQGKDLVSVFCDYRSDISVREIRASIRPAINQRGYTLYEDVVQVASNFETVGIAYADIIGYLSARIDIISNDSELFENLSEEHFEQNGKLRKLRTSIQIMDKIKQLTIYEVKLGEK